MFDDKNNIVGVLFVGLCAVVAGVFIWEIVTGTRFTYSGPRWLLWIVGAIFVGGIVYGMAQSVSSRKEGGGMAQWPSPNAGQRSWWRRLRDRFR